MRTFVKICNSMANDLTEQLTRIGHKAELLTTRYGMLVQELRRLRADLAERDARILALQADLEHSRLEAEHLRLAANVAPTVQSLQQSRAFVADLVREIDACVDDLIRDV